MTAAWPVESRFTRHRRRPTRSRVPRDSTPFHPLVIEVSRALFEDGHRAAATLQTFIAVNNRVKEMSGRNDLDGVDLMAQVLRPETPLLPLADLTTETGRNI